jgi:predicted ATPase with chaperone activity
MGPQTPPKGLKPPALPLQTTWLYCKGPGRSAHHDLLLGPPGAGESMLARLTTILPEMTLAEAFDTIRIHRVTGLTGDRMACVTARPCRIPTSPWPMEG